MRRSWPGNGALKSQAVCTTSSRVAIVARRIFAAADDYQKFLNLLEKQKQHLPFFVYAYCLMSNQISDLQRQVDREPRASIRFACGGDATVVLIDYLLHDREAQTGAALFG